MALLDDLLARMRATPELRDIRIVENEAVDDETFVFKVQASIRSNRLQVRFLADKDFQRYSFQLYSDRPLLRWDNTPYYPNLSNSPHHFHDQSDNVFPSALTGNLLVDFEIVMAEVRKFMNL
ncbi:MAG: toxin-antitoxin system TumE family protein [Chloroflexota bacterium]